MAATSSPAPALKPIDSLVAEVITDDVSDTYVSKTLFAVSEFSNVVLAGAKVISGEALLCANLGFGLRLVSESEDLRHTLLFDTGPEGAIFIRNCGNLGIRLGEVESIAVSHGHFDHMAALPHAVEAIVKDGGQVTVHVNPGMFDERAIRLKSGMVKRFCLDEDGREGQTKSKLVLIGRNLDRAQLRSRLEACLAPTALV